jgi:hypothetical protein
MPRRRKLKFSEGEPTPELVAGELESDPLSSLVRKIDRFGSERRQVDALRPNKYNEQLFPDSLAPESIALLAEDLEARNLDVPVRIMSDGTIIDGERRWRAAKSLKWDEIDVVSGPMLSDEELLDRIVGACTSARQMTAREQVNIYVAVSERCKRDAGRAQGRPQSKTKPNGEGFLSPVDIAKIATAKAGFDSVRTAERAVAVFKRGSDALQLKVLQGKLSVSAAYAQVPKQARTPKPVLKSLAASEPDPVRLLPTAEESRGDSCEESGRQGNTIGAKSLTSGAPAADAGPCLALPNGKKKSLDRAALDEPESHQHDSDDKNHGADAATDEQPDRASAPEPTRVPEGIPESAVLDADRSAFEPAPAPIPIEPAQVERAFDCACASLVELMEYDPDAVRMIAGRVYRMMKKVLRLVQQGASQAQDQTSASSVSSNTRVPETVL